MTGLPVPTRLALVLLCLGVLPPDPASAQGRTIDRSPARPRLPTGADSNDANAYFALGAERLQREPHLAAAAFHWAARLDPRSAEAVYARRVSLLLEDRSRLRLYVEDTTGQRSTADTRYIDSLYLHAVHLDPFLREDLEALLLSRYAEIVWLPEVRRGGMLATEADVTPADLRVYIQRHLRDYSAALSARFAYCEGRYDSALAQWAELARTKPRTASIHAERARAFYHLGRLDSARASMEKALAVARRDDADSARFAYESKAAWEHALGRIHERLNDLPAARAAYERAVIEDLAYFPAHLQLAQLHLTQGDTAAAMREFERAAVAAEDEYLPRANYGFRLATRGQLDSAVIHLRRATAIEPLAVESHLMLGLVFDAQGDTAQAREAFARFAALAARGHPRLERVRARLAR